jgi:hypothetical protein
METVLRANLPLGQKLIKAGFPAITEKELYERLGCEEIARLANQEVKSKAVASLNEFRKRRFSFFRYTLTESSERFYVAKHFFFEEVDVRSRPRNYVDWELKQECRVDFCSIESYVQQEIPDACLDRVDKAKELGLKNFFVAFPKLRPKKDPIIVGRLEQSCVPHPSAMFFVAEWGK